jgi:hypothetical protein
MLKSVEKEFHTNDITKASKRFFEKTEKIDRKSSKIEKRSEKKV